MSNARIADNLSACARSESSIRKHLLRKVRYCDQAREMFMDRLACAEGNDVFKCVLLLNCIECHGYVAETQLQAYESFRLSRRVAAIGFLFLIAMFVAMVPLRVFLKDFKLEANTLSIIAGVMTTFISGTCLVLYRESLKKMESFHLQLREVQKIVFGLYLNGISGETVSAQESRREIVRILMRADKGKEPDEALQPNVAAA
jgi:hypothetical protein